MPLSGPPAPTPNRSGGIDRGGYDVEATATPLTLEAALAQKRRLVGEARALARSADGSTDVTLLNRVLLDWSQTSSAGSEHDGKLWWQLKRACADFYDACRAGTAA
jgi:hypothetical protein